MPRIFKQPLLAGFLLILSLCAPARAEPVPAVHILGSRNLMPMAQQVAESYMRERPDAHIVISPGGTYRGYKDLLDGTIDIAMASSKPSQQTLTILGKDARAFVSTVVGVVAMVPIVHPQNPVSTVTTAQLHDIFTGHIDNMKYVGGGDVPIKVLIGSPSDGLTESWRAILIGDDTHRTPVVEIMPTRERLARVRIDPGAISFASSADVNASVKVLKVDGVAGDENTVRSGRYVLVAPLILATTDHASAAAKDFIGYFLTASKNLRAPGFIAIDAGQAQAPVTP